MGVGEAVPQAVGGGAALVPKGQQLEVHGRPALMCEHSAVVAITCPGAATATAMLRCRCCRRVAVAPSIADHHSRCCVAIVP